MIRARIVAELDGAATSLSLAERDPVEAVHDARRRMKRIRAGVRLFRPLGRRTFGTEEQIVVEAGRLLAPIRDRHVAHYLLAERERWAGDLVPPPYSPDVERRSIQTMVLLTGVRVRAKDGWPVTNLDDERLLDGLDRSYRQTRQRWRRSSRSLDPAELHDCRKSVKRTTYQLQILGAQRFGQRLVELDRLGDALGRHHDLFLAGKPNRGERKKLEREVLAVGQPIFDLKPAGHRRWLRQALDIETA